jgi:serine/threonine protein kinase
VRLTDFATAHRMDTPCAKPFAGSPQYIAPEIVRGGQPTPKVDVFGIGCVVCYLWTGKHVFLRDSDFLTWKAILEEEPVLPAAEGVQEECLRNFVATAIDKNPDQRRFIPLI